MIQTSSVGTNRHSVKKGDARLDRFFKPKRYWPNGAWHEEPDEWSHETAFAYRGYFGAWFLFVGVPLDHPYHLRKAHDMPYVLHIPFTYAGTLNHLPVPMKQLWWFGLHYGNQWCATPYDIVHGDMGKPYIPLAQVERDAHQLTDWFRQHATSPHGVTEQHG
jgi:hypothetical protein